MKIYFDGASWSGGKEVSPLEAFPHLMAEMLNAEYDNFSLNGGSNQRCARNILIKHDVTQYDLVVLQFSHRQRLEFIKPDLGEWRQQTSRKAKKDFWTDWYKYVYTEEYGICLEMMWKKSIENHCALHNVPCLITSSNQDDKVKYDFFLDFPFGKYEKMGDIVDECGLGHPSPKGHSMIATDLVALLRQQNMI